MKLKFRADPKDWLIFCLFAIFLLYFIAISVGNVIFLVRGIELPGMNPIPAFEGDLFPVTMIIYLIVLIIVFTSVSSYFFDREKGLGISTSPKKEKGYSRWATDKEMKQHLKKVMWLEFL